MTHTTKSEVRASKVCITCQPVGVSCSQGCQRHCCVNPFVHLQMGLDPSGLDYARVLKAYRRSPFCFLATASSKPRARAQAFDVEGCIFLPEAGVVNPVTQKQFMLSTQSAHNSDRIAHSWQANPLLPSDRFAE
eukprot:4674873-Amphidinium_carterae.2